MGLFSRKKQNTFQTAMLEKVHGRSIRYAAQRVLDENGNPTEVILGKNGAINTIENRIVLMCNGKEVFRCDAEGASISELMSLNGVVIEGVNAITGEKNTVVAYFTGYR